ncbi:hypothetical protein LINPERPRIM_LOCUS37005 [Linum perenne]
MDSGGPPLCPKRRLKGGTHTNSVSSTTRKAAIPKTTESSGTKSSAP